MNIQISGSLACMTLYFSVLLFTIYCYNVLLLSVFTSIAKQYVHYALCTMRVCMCDAAIHEIVPYLGDLCSLLASSLHSVSLRNLFLPTIATVYDVVVWLMCLCHKTGRYRHTLQKLNSGRIFCVYEQHSAEDKTPTECKQQRLHKLECENEKKVWERYCFLQREKAKWSSMSQSHCVYFIQSITE